MYNNFVFSIQGHLYNLKATIDLNAPDGYYMVEISDDILGTVYERYVCATSYNSACAIAVDRYRQLLKQQHEALVKAVTDGYRV